MLLLMQTYNHVCVSILTERWLAFGGWKPSLKLLEGDEKFPLAGKYRHVICVKH